MPGRWWVNGILNWHEKWGPVEALTAQWVQAYRYFREVKCPEVPGIIMPSTKPKASGKGIFPQSLASRAEIEPHNAKLLHSNAHEGHSCGPPSIRLIGESGKQQTTERDRRTAKLDSASNASDRSRRTRTERRRRDRRSVYINQYTALASCAPRHYGAAHSLWPPGGFDGACLHCALCHLSVIRVKTVGSLWHINLLLDRCQPPPQAVHYFPVPLLAHQILAQLKPISNFPYPTEGKLREPRCPYRGSVSKEGSDQTRCFHHMFFVYLHICDGNPYIFMHIWWSLHIQW